MTNSFHRFIAFALCALILAAQPVRAEAIKAVASIAPIHSLLAGVMQGLGEPALLVRGAGSPHAYSLKPSDARRLNNADLVFWVGPGLEGFLVKPLAALSKRVSVVQLSPGNMESDPHIWLDPRNAAAMVGVMVKALSGADAGNKARYEANGAKLTAMLIRLEKEIRASLGPVAVVPYLVFHDAYRYFEKRFDLASQGFVAVHAERPPGAGRVLMLRRKIRDKNISCVFTEPQFEPVLAKTLIEGTHARTAVLDPLGADLKPGPGLYAKLMRGMAAALLGCLGANG
ncbi:MAG: zinc ABC transporter substrate-binding protein [Proteobacteria bacterium]|nr:zinc ABC transporter substrate-binding protein [Pseudomonadota bacterium]MDA1023827.1 zinc ABC transporter substrate-binding protein [Pseudomonadota bacterium]